MSESESALRARAQTLFAKGKLLRSVPLRSVAGSGQGLACVLCGELIHDTEAEIDVYFLPRPFEPYFFHPTCYTLWFNESFAAR